jgi:DNA-directed RNA polymerase specialized sigma24 family protein
MIMMDKHNKFKIDKKINSLYKGARGAPMYEDAISEVLLELVKSDRLYSLDEEGFYSYVHKSAKNRVKNKIKKQNRDNDKLFRFAREGGFGDS